MRPYLALGQLRLDGGPRLGLGGVAEQVHDDGAARDGLVHFEQVLAGHPAVVLGILPRLAVLPDAHDDVESIVAEVEALAVALGPVANEGERVLLEVVQELLLRPVGALCSQEAVVSLAPPKGNRGPVKGSAP